MATPFPLPQSSLPPRLALPVHHRPLHDADAEPRPSETAASDPSVDLDAFYTAPRLDRPDGARVSRFRTELPPGGICWTGWGKMACSSGVEGGGLGWFGLLIYPPLKALGDQKWPEWSKSLKGGETNTS